MRKNKTVAADAAAPSGLREAGALMANTMFNLAQRPGTTIDAHLCEQMDTMRRQWDAAVRVHIKATEPAGQPDERAAFEVRASERYGQASVARMADGVYVQPAMRAAWWAWETRAAAPQAALTDEQLAYLETAARSAEFNGHKTLADGLRSILATPPTERMSDAARDATVLTSNQISAVWEGMPGGADGFRKQCGYQQFAEAIIDAARKAEIERSGGEA